MLLFRISMHLDSRGDFDQYSRRVFVVIRDLSFFSTQVSRILDEKPIVIQTAATSSNTNIYFEETRKRT
jgi:hypothetical protein